MSAFDTVNIQGPYYRTVVQEYKPKSNVKNDYWERNSNTPVIYPWGRPHRNMLFRGPHEFKNLDLPLSC